MQLIFIIMMYGTIDIKLCILFKLHCFNNAKHISIFDVNNKIKHILLKYVTYMILHCFVKLYLLYKHYIV